MANYSRRFNDLNRRLDEGFDSFQRSMSGINYNITGADRALVQQGVGGASDIVLRQLERDLPRLQGLTSGNAGARGIGGSGIEGIQQGMLSEQALRGLQDVLSQQQQLGAQYLMQVPFQRAGMQMSRNQALFQGLISTVQPQYQTRMWGAEMKQADDQRWLQAIGGLGQGVGALPWSSLL